MPEHIEDLRYEKHAGDAPGEGVGVITLNRPGKLNTITAAMAAGLQDLVAEINADDGVRVVVLTGEGERAFSAGSDVNAMDAYGDNWALRNRIEYNRALLDLRKPMIGAIRGYAIGGGLELALTCDIRLAGRSAKFGAGEIKLGWHGGGGVTQLLPRIVGPGEAMRLLLTGDIIDAEEAIRIGLVQQVVDDSDLLNEALTLARRIAGNAPIAAQMIKNLVRTAMSDSLDAGLRYENDSFMLCWQTQDAAEGVRAFGDKRRPHFKGH